MSRMRIFPPVATLYPGDRQTFNVVAVPPPAMWQSVNDSGDIKSDFTLEVDPAGSQVSGGGGHALYSGIGSVEFTIDDQLRPTSTGQFQIQGQILDTVGFLYVYTLIINPTAIEVRDEANNQIYTESYTTVSGDVYRLELLAGFRFYRNTILKHSRVSLATDVTYPMQYRAGLIEPSATAPSRIPPPKLIGDWQIFPNVLWSNPSHGSIMTNGPAPITEYFGGTVPGVYELVVSMENTADATNTQVAKANITIPPLQILGPTSVTLNPGQKVRFKTNYDAAQSGDLIAWSVVSGGGSFTQGEFTAPANYGTTIVRATATINDQVADITIITAAVISNANGYIAAKASEQIDFEHNIPLFPKFLAAGFVSAGTGDVTPALPLGIQVNDILLLLVETANQAVSTPSGWTIVADSPQGTGTAGDVAATRLSIFYKRVTLPITAPTITDPGDHAIAQILAFRDCIGSGDPWDVTAGNTGASSTSISIPGDTTTLVNCLVLLAVAHGIDTASAQVSGYTNSDLANLTERTDVATTQGNGGGFALATGEKATAGAYGATTATLGSAFAQGRISIALKPAVYSWSANIGSINSSSGLWTAPSLTGQTAVITIGNGTFIVRLEIDVLDVFPFPDFSLPVSWDRNLSALMSMSEDRTNRITREKALPFDSYPVKLSSRTLAECNTLDAFFDAHGLGTPFILEDKLRNIRKVGWFDSPIRHEARDECDIDLAFQFLEARF